MPPQRSSQKLLDLFADRKVVDLPTIRAALGDLSVQSTFRYLKLVPYRRSYDHNGRYYTLYKLGRFDHSGLWSFQGIHFSVDGSLRNTVRRFVHEALAGMTHRELQHALQLRVHNTLLDLLQTQEITREALSGFYVYFHVQSQVRETQISRRKEQVAAVQLESEVTDAMVIEVLLVLVRHPGAQWAEVVKRLRGHSPPITADHIHAVFHRYDLDPLGEKGGRSRR